MCSVTAVAYSQFEADMVTVGSLVECVSAIRWMIQRNGNQRETKTERRARKELGGPLVCTKMWSPQGIEVGWENVARYVCQRKKQPQQDSS